ncbi:MAG: TlpA disulfide reductase family protein [Melioribacteraceae bacterium]
MKILSLLVAVTLLITSCSQENKQVIFTGEIINPTSDMVWLTVNDSTLSTKLDKNNKFIFKVGITEANKYRLDHGGFTYLFLKPGSVLHITLDTKDFDRSITYKGTAQKENEYLKKRLLLKETLEKKRFEIPNMSEKEFESIINNTLGAWEKTLLELKNIDSKEYANFKNAELEEVNKINTIATDYYKSMVNIRPGNDAIDIKVVNINGRDYSLKDFKNKVVCIDVWASWCTACLKEMPYFEKLADKYKNHNIAFIAISVDDTEEVWKKLLKERNVNGLQLWAKGGHQSDFFKDYQLNDLPVYIVIDKNGKIVKSRASRPSERLEEVIIEALNK